MILCGGKTIPALLACSKFTCLSHACFVIFKGNAAEVVKAIKEHRVEVPWSIHGLVPIWELIFISLLDLENNLVKDITVSRRR